jgi:hypothetical protein
MVINSFCSLESSDKLLKIATPMSSPLKILILSDLGWVYSLLSMKVTCSWAEEHWARSSSVRTGQPTLLYLKAVFTLWIYKGPGPETLSAEPSR